MQRSWEIRESVLILFLPRVFTSTRQAIFIIVHLRYYRAEAPAFSHSLLASRCQHKRSQVQNRTSCAEQARTGWFFQEAAQEDLGGLLPLDFLDNSGKNNCFGRWIRDCRALTEHCGHGSVRFWCQKSRKRKPAPAHNCWCLYKVRGNPRRAMQRSYRLEIKLTVLCLAMPIPFWDKGEGP